MALLARMINCPVKKWRLFLYRALKLVEKVNDQTDVNVISFKDKDLISMYASEGITALAQTGIINGFEDGNFRPQAHTTRAEAAYIILNLLQQ